MSVIASTLSSSANTIISFLSNVPEGYSVTRDEITKATGIDVSKPSGQQMLRRAREAMFDQAHVLFRASGGKLLRLGDEDKIAEANRRGERATGEFAAAAKVASSVTDYNLLDQESRDIHTKVMLKSSVVGHMSKNAVMNEVVNGIRRMGGSGKLSGRDFLQLLSSTGHP